MLFLQNLGTSQPAESEDAVTLVKTLFRHKGPVLSMAAKTISPFSALLMLCLITFWGSSFVVVKITLLEGLTPTRRSGFSSQASCF
jgi:hypothetical protein